MSISRKFQRSKSKYTLSQKIISAVTAAGFIMQPFTAFANSINKVNNNDTIKVNGNVTNIWADKVVSNSAVNVFKDFQLDANNIANMYFNTKGASGADAANLVNFVNSRIDINGTVNAIQNSQIGGNLFFLSKEGMAVGKSGVINTGSLYVMTPTADYIDNMKVVAGTADAATAEKELNAITNITKDANAWQVIPVNTSGTITVLGKVNATNEVQMRAAKIGVGKNVSGELKDDEGTVIMEADAANKEAYIKTGITNFADIVNIKNADGTASITESGLTGDLQATQTGSGDIVLSAYVDGATEKNNLEELPVVGATLGPIAETAENTFVEQDFNASVDVYGTVETTGEKGGNININATAVNSNADFNEQINDYELNDNDVAQLANVKAEVNIDGTVQAADNVTVKAEAINRYIDNSGAFAKANIAIASGTPITGDIAYSVLNTEANVNITSEGSVESENGNVDIDAKAETLAASAASVTALKFKAAGGTTGANVPAVSVLYTGADNKANVTVEGNVNAAKDISIDADADMKVDAENKMGIKGKMGNQFVVGVTVAGAENSASVHIKDEDNSNNVIDAVNDLSVNANATSDFTSGTSIKAPEASAMAVAVNVTDFNSNANVNIDTDLTAGNDLTVKADNIITDDNVIAESTIGSGKYMSAASQIVTGHVEQKKGEVKEWIGTLAGKISAKLQEKLSGSDDADIPSLQLSEIFKAGATVNYSGQTHGSNVTIGENSTLNAGKKMDIEALTKIEDAHITATGTTASYNDAYPAEATLNAAVLVNNMDNSSSVVIKDAVTDEQGTEHKATLSAVDGVDINASTRFEYNRIANMIQEVKDAAAQIKNAVSGLDGAIKSDFDAFLGNLDTQIDTWESAFATADETFATSDSGVLAIGEAATAGLQVLTALNNLNTMLDGNEGGQVAADVKATIQGASDILTGALAFADPNSYGNFAAASASKGSSGDTDAIAGHHPSAINGAGTVMVNNVDSVSKVEVGSNSVIASNGKVNLNAENYMKDVSLGGLNTVPLTNSGGGTAASIGATVNYSDFNTDTIVAVNDGANISGGDINIAGSNEIDHVSVAGGAGMGPSDETGSNGIVLNGMLSFVNGSSDILTVVDDGAILKADQKQYTETVEGESGSTEETKTSTGNISISGHNDTNIVNVAAGLNLGSGSGAIGMGLAYNDFAVKNIAGVADISEQINNLYSYKNDDGSINVDEVEELKAKLVNEYTASKSTDENRSISAYGFNVDAATEGSIQSVSVAASASKNDDTGETSFFGKIKGSISNTENKLLGSGGKLDTVTGRIFGTESGKANDFFNMGSNTHGANGGGINLVGGTSGKGGFMPSFSIAGSGSVSMNMLDNATQAIVDNAKISMKSTDGVNGDIRVTARDTAYAGAYSGAAALQWKSGGSASDTSVGFSGAAGVNDIDNVIKATISNSVIDKAGTIDTLALSGGEQLALGLGLNVAKSGSTSGYTGNAAVSVNLIDHDVEALHENNTVEKAEDVNVSAYARDIENTGGGSLGAGQQKVGVGATVGVAMLNNNITAGIKGGEYKNVGNVDVEALNALQNITVGIAAGATVPSGSDGASAVVEGAGVYNEVHNTTNAFIEGPDEKDVVISTVNTVSDDKTGNVNVIAQDVAITEDSIYEQALDGLADGKTEIAKRMGSDFDITGASELNGIETDDIKAQLNNKEAEGTGTQSNENSTEEVNLNKYSGSSIITVAGGLAATTGKGAGGAAVAITDIENTYTADVKYADITADELDVDAGSNSNIVTVAGGIAAANKGSGVGSVSWNDVLNTANVNIANSHINAQQTTATAANQAQIVSVGGQISGAGKAAVGATLSYVGLDNTTKVNISTTEFDERTANEGTSVTAKANNTSDSYNIGAGVSAGGTASVSGTVVVTQTKGTAGAVMDGAKINNAKEIIAHASDDTDILSVIGTVNIAGKAAVGAGVAYTEIGGVSDDKEKAEQHVTAEINNSTINTDDAGSTVEVKAEDEARVINVAVGVGGAANAAVQGASATTLINKETSAGINSTNIDAGHEGSTKANVTVEAQNDSEITSSASTVAAASQGAGVGAGIAVNRIIQQTNAAVNGGTMKVNNLTVKANATPRIENIGVGGGIAGQGAGISGSVAVNMIENDVTAHIGSGATIVADGSVGVVATSDEQIANYAGQLAVGGIGAGVGVSVSVNQIAGTTSATVGGEKEDATSVVAKGNDSLTTDTVINVDINDDEKSEIHNTLIDDETVAITKVIDRQNEERSGLIVDASSTRDLKSFLITAGVAGEGAGVTGTVNVNMIDGATSAGITNTNVNNVDNAGNVFVNAGDYSNMSGFVGSAAVGGIGAGVGLASDTNTINRKVTASVDKSDIKAQGFEVDADSAQGISSFGVGAGAAGVGGGAAGVVTVTELNNTTKAMLNNSKVNANTVSIKANHTGIVNAGNVSLGGAGLGVGAGLAVGVLKDNSITEVTVKGNDAEEDTITASGDVTIAATNTAVVKPVISANGVGVFGGVACATSINNLNSTVKTNIEDVGITSTGGSISGTADNTFNVKAYMGTIGGGAVGVGAGVTVNTIDSTVQTNVNGSALDAAKDITLTAQETRNIEQLATNYAAGGAAAGANIAITNVGQAVKNDENSNSKAADKIADANKVYGENNKDANKLLEGAESALKTAVIDSGKATPHVDAELGGGKDSQITVNITNSNIKADNNVTAKATETDNITMTLGSGSAGMAAVNAGVGILNVYRNVGVNITGAEITAAKAVELASVINGSSNLDVYQGTAGILGVNAAYGGATSDGTSGVTISSGTIDGGSINILAEDAGRTDVDAIGITAGVVSAGAIVAEGTNESQTAVNISDTEMNSDADVDIKAERQAKDSEGNTTDAKGNKYASLNINATAGSGGLLGAGAGLGAVAEEKGSVKVNLSGMRNTLTAGEALNINAFNAPVVNVSATSGAGSLIAAASVTYAEANIDMDTEVNVDGYNTLAAGSDKDKNEGINISAEADAAQNVKMQAVGVAIGGAGQANAAEVNITSDVKVDIAGNTAFKANVEKENVDVNIKADNTATQSANAYGLVASGLVASGTNLGKTNSNLTTTVDLKGSRYDSGIDNLTANAHSKVDISNHVNGDGGALLDVSPYAAKTENSVISNTNVNIGGSWDITGDVDVEALHENEIDLNADALKAAVAGLSGVHADNKIENKTGVKFSNATVNSDGSQTISARNTIDYTNVVKGSGYGAANVTAVWAEDDLDLKTNVSIENSELKAEESITVDALTGDAGYNPDGEPVASVDKEVTIKSAGVIAGTDAISTDNIDFINNIKIDKDSSVATVGKDIDKADITFTAADRTNFTDIVTADTQGGVVGASGSVLNNNFNRENTITVEGTVDKDNSYTVDSNHDANFDAGNTSVLNLTLKSNAYNKTAAPIATNPTINGIMKQTSSINFTAGKAVESLRNINVAAGEGDTTIAKESKMWRWVTGGETGSGSIASTVDGELSPEDADVTTTVTVNGELEAGKNNELTITITDDGKEAALKDAIEGYNGGEAFGTAEGALIAAQKAYDEVVKKEGGLEDKSQQLAEKQKEYENNKTAYDIFAAQDVTISANLEEAGNNLTNAQNALSTAKVALEGWINEKLKEYNDKPSTIQDIDRETFIEGLTDATTAWYALYHTDYDKQTDNIANIERQINGDGTAANPGLQAIYNDYAAQKESNDANLAAFDIVALEQQIEQLNNEIEGIVGGADYIAVKEDLDTAKVNYDAALEEGFSEENINANIFGNAGSDKYVSIEASPWFEDLYGSPAEKIGMAAYASALLERYGQLADMMQEYAGTEVSTTYSDELTRVQSELQALGIGRYDEKKGVFAVTENSIVPTIELEDLTVSGGDINISGGSLNGSGTMTANGNPILTIDNQSNFFLKVNDITVDNDGGSIMYNNTAIDGSYGGIDVNADTGGSGAQINISSSGNVNASESEYYIPDIGIFGTVSNPYGDITISNQYNSIYVAGKVDGVSGILQEAGSLKGRTVTLTAGGSVTQGYSDGITDVAGDPKKALKKEYIAAIQAALIDKLTDAQKIDNGKYYAAFNTVGELAQFLTGLEVGGETLDSAKALEAAKQLTGQIDDGRAGITAGGAIYINAASINVNGKIQSGYEDYKLNLNQEKAQELISKGNTLGQENLPDAQFKTNEYLVTTEKNGAYYDNNTGKFVYGVKAWYNPTTGQIFTEDIEQAGGGRIYLTGAIANTNAGGGKLIVLDGGSNYDINSTVKDMDNQFTLKLGSINAATVDGRIEINDTNTGDKVEYNRIIDKDGNVNIIVTKNGSVIENDPNITPTTYNPQDDQYYIWSNGTANRVTVTYEHVSDTSWFGLAEDKWEETIGSLDEVTKDNMQVGITESKDEMLPTVGNIISDGSVNGYHKLDNVAGSSDKNAGTLYQIAFERKGKPKQGVNANGDLLYWGKDEDGNQILVTNDTGSPYYLKKDDGTYVYETVISDKVTNTENKDPLGWWGKTVTTTWKETSGMITAYNFGLKADNPINIEFVGNKDGSIGDIISNSDILLGGDIRMGEVDIISTVGNISYLDDATVISDDASFSAATGIDVIQKNVSKDLHLNAVSASGDINIQAIAANANINDVYIDNVSTDNGSVNITAEGDLLNGNTGTNGYAVKGDGITLQSYTGTIGAADSRLLIDGDVHYGVNEDTTHNATNAYANGGIYLSEATGNMYLGEINSENGDVVLEVKDSNSNAGFVDAIVNNDVMSESDQDRIAAWKEMGLLDDGTADAKLKLNSNVNQLKNLEAAAGNGSFFMDGKTTLTEAQEQGKALVTKGQEFVKLMQGGSEAVQAARKDLNAKQGALNEAIANLSDDPASKKDYKYALAAYNEAYDYYAEVGAKYEQDKANFIENSVFADNEQAVNWLYNYEAIGNAEADNYGWTDKQLLYAVQDTVINPNAGSVSDVKTANVTGNNITFISDTGNLGVVDDQASSLSEIGLKAESLADLFTGDIKDTTGFLEKLASARAGDVVWGDDDVVIRRTTPVSVKLNSDNGKVIVQNSSGGTPTAKHIYLLAKDSVLNADEFAANDLRLSGQEGLNVNEVTGSSIYLEGGSGSIDALNDALDGVQVTLNNNGFISANAAGDVKLQQVLEDPNEIVDFTLGSVAGTNVNITANGNIVSKADDIGYINASGTINLTSEDGGIGTINLTSEDGGIGTTTKGLRIKNSGAVVNTDVQDAISIEAVQDGTLILGEMKQESGGVTVESEGTIMLGREDDGSTEDTDESVTGSIDAKGDVTLHAEDDIIISGKLHVNATDNDTASDNGMLQLHSNTGDIVQTTDKEDKNIVAANVGIAAVGGDVELDNQYNIIKKVDLQAVGGSLGLTVSNPEGFYVDMGGFTNKQGGDIKLTNSNGSVNITTEDIAEPAQKDPAKINGSLIVTANKVVEETEANVNNYGIIKAAGNINFNAEDNVNNEEALIAGRDVSFGAGNDILNKDIVDAGRNVNFNAAENIYNNSTVNADETIEFTAVDGVINSDTVNGKDVIMQAIEQELENILAKDSVTLNGDRIHGQNITQNTEADGDLIINTDSNSGSGPIESLVIDKIDANDKSVFTELWAVEADITTVDDKMDFNDIMIEENAWLENSGTLTTIYGNVPVKDDDANVHIYQSYPSMYVNFIDADTVETDGRLLSLDDYWYAYDQRFTAENHLRWQHGRYLDEDWKQAYGYGLSLHNRYGLIDYQEFTETNAGADEVAVEA